MDALIVLEARSLYRFFHAGDDEALALQGVDLTVRAGELVAVTGPSGSGKSTLLACLAGLDDPDGGTVLVGGERLSRQTEAVRARVRARRIGVLFQHENLVAHLSVAANVTVARRLAGLEADATQVGALLERCGIGTRAHARPAQLSGGELARAGLAVAAAADPLLLLADEPTGELDEATAAQVVGLLRERADEGGAVLVATHGAHVAAEADRVLELHDGRLVG